MHFIVILILVLIVGYVLSGEQDAAAKRAREERQQEALNRAYHEALDEIEFDRF